MNDKSYVSMERHVCLVCGVAYDTGSLLLDKRLRPSLEHYTTTGWGLCAEHQQLFAQGFVALVEFDPRRSELAGADRIKPEGAYRTGRLAHLRRDVIGAVFNVPIATDLPCIFVEPGVIEQLQSMLKPASD